MKEETVEGGTRRAPALPAKHTFTVQEVADLLGVNHKTIRAEIDGGRIACTRLGRLIRIPWAEVLRLIGG